MVCETRKPRGHGARTYVCVCIKNAKKNDRYIMKIPRTIRRIYDYERVNTHARRSYLFTRNHGSVIVEDIIASRIFLG